MNALKAALKQFHAPVEFATKLDTAPGLRKGKVTEFK
jgi:hypothetical protein